MKIPGADVVVDVVDALYYFTALDGIERLDRFPRGKKVPGPDSDQMITNVLGGKKGPAYVLSLKNGNFLLLGEKAVVFTIDGWKNISEVTDEELIFQAFTKPRYFQNAGKNIPYKNQLTGASLPVSVPERMNFEFAQWLGMFMSVGFYKEQMSWVGIRTHNKDLRIKFTELTKKIFGITPIEKQDRRGRRKPLLVFSSRNVINFIKTFIGSRRMFRKIPQFLMESSLEEHVEFLKGFQYDAYLNKDGELIFYREISKPIADFLGMIFRNCGYVVNVNQISYASKDSQGEITGHTGNFYEVRVVGKGVDNLPIELLNPEHDKILNSPGNYLVLVEDLEPLKPKTYDPHYSAWRNLKNKPHKLIKHEILHKLNSEIKPEGYFIGVKNIKRIEDKDLLSLKLLSPKGLFINGFLVAGS